MKLKLLNDDHIGQIAHQYHPTIWGQVMEKVSEQILQDKADLLNILDNIGIRDHHFINIKQYNNETTIN